MNLNTIIEEEKGRFETVFGETLGLDEPFNNGYVLLHVKPMLKYFLTTAMQRAYEAGKADSAQENTPETEWEKEFDAFFNVRMFGEKEGSWNAPDLFTMKRFISSTISSRDTYWKERVRKEVEQGMQGVSDTIPTPKHIKKMARSWGEEGTDYNKGFIEGARWVIGLVYWFVIPFAGERGITIDTRIPTPITNEDNLK